MNTYFLDSNILLDFLGNRQPFGKYALQILNQARVGAWELWTSDNAIITTYYLIEKELGEKVAKQKIGKLLLYLEIQPASKADLQNALISPFKDFEDGVQHACALAHGGIHGIITRNKRDFKASQIPVLGPEELFEPN